MFTSSIRQQTRLLERSRDCRPITARRVSGRNEDLRQRGRKQFVCRRGRKDACGDQEHSAHRGVRTTLRFQRMERRSMSRSRRCLARWKLSTPRSITSIKKIPTNGAEHNVYVTPDGKYLVAGSVGGRNVSMIRYRYGSDRLVDIRSGRPADCVRYESRTAQRATCTSSFPTFTVLSVVDFKARKEISRVTLPDIAPELRNKGQINAAPAHGIGVMPDGKLLFVCSRLNSHVYVYSMPDLKMTADIEVGHDPDWITFSPDSKTAYVASAGTNSISVVDIAQKKQVAKIDVGKAPKRNSTMMLKQ